MTARSFLSSSSIEDLWTGDVYQLQVNPTIIRDGRRVSIKRTPIPGAPLPRVVPGAGDRRPIQFEVFFMAESQVYDSSWVKSTVDSIMGLTYSRITNPDTGRRQVTPVFVRLGDLIQLPGYLSAVDVDWGPFVDSKLGPLEARLKVTFEEAGEELGSALQAVDAQGGAFRQRGFSVQGSTGGSELVFSSRDAAIDLETETGFDFT